MDKIRQTDRREFIKTSGKLSVMAILAPQFAFFKNNDDKQLGEWRAMMKDPVYRMFKRKPHLDHIMGLFARPQGEAAFDPKSIQENIQKLQTIPKVNTGHSFLDLSIKTGLAHIDATFQGNHPKYGVGQYSRIEHDAFPPTIIATVDALSLWGMNIRAAELFHYWLSNMVYDNGTINYYGTSISEYGQLLHTAMILEERAGRTGWWEEGFSKLDSIAEYLLLLHSSVSDEDGLISGVPEADTLDQIGKYFHNNAWVAKGLEQWANLCEKTQSNPSTSVGVIRNICAKLKENTLSAIRKTWPKDHNNWWLPGRLGYISQPRNLTDGNEASYTNYRYWPELLSSGILPADMTNRLVNARLAGGGQFCGITRFLDWFDDWPLADYLYSLWALKRKNDFLLSLYGHIAYHQCEGHLTAYEQFNFPGDPKGSKVADYCLPAQLVAARAGRLLNKR